MRLRFLAWGLLFLACLVRVFAQAVTPPRLSGVNGGGAVDLGQRVVLTPIFSASGTPPLQYQWRKGGAELAGQTGATLVIDPVVDSDAGTFAVTVSNSAGSSSGSAELSVRAAAAPLITTAPRALVVEAGQSAVFTFVATGSFPRTYQWRKDGTNLAGATNASLILSAVTAADAGTYSVQVSNSLGSTVSASAALTVNAARPPVLGNFPAEIGPVVQGRTVTLSAPVTSGSTPLSYQWRKEGVPIAGATAASLVFDGIAFSDAGTYSVVVTNVAGAATSAGVRVSVQPAAPPGRLKFRNAVAHIDLGLEFLDTNSLFESQPTAYQWYQDGRAISGATNARYQVPRVSTASAGTYFVVATNVAGSTTSEAALVSVLANNGAFGAPWVTATRDADLVYFVFANPARIERFNLATDSWLASVPLSATPTAAAIHNGALYLASGAIISRYSLTGAAEGTITSGFLNDVTELQALGGFLFAADNNGQTTTVRLSDGAKVSSLPYPANLYRPTVLARSTGVIFGRNSMNSGALVGMRVQSDGSLLRLNSTSNLLNLSYGERLFLSRDERRIFSEGGRVFSATDSDLIGSLGGPLDDLDFAANGEPVALRGGILQVYDANFYEARRLVTNLAGQRLFIRENDAFIFGTPDSAGRPAKIRVSLAQAQAPSAVAPLAPEKLGFTPDVVLLDRDGVVLLMSKLHRQIFRWSTTQRRFLASLPLQGAPNRIAYSAAHHRIYVAYADNRLSQIKLDAGGTTEVAFVTVPQQILSIAAAGEYVWVDFSESVYSTATRLLFDRDGRQSYIGGGYSSDYAWHPGKRRLYHFQDDSSPNDLRFTEVRADGSIGLRRDSPYHGEIAAVYPIRVSADGATVLLGSGKIFDGETLALVASLPHEIRDAQWLGARVVTGRATERGVEVERWSGAAYSADRSAVLPGRLMALLSPASDRVVAVTLIDGLVHITAFDQELGVLSSDSVGLPDRLANLSSRATVGRGDQLLIPGFVIAGDTPKTLLVRAVGPGLAGFGVAGALDDPLFTVHKADGAVIASNDNWGTGSNTSFLPSITARVGAFSLGRGSRDAAALVTLDPGAYTVQIRGAGDTTGVALVEVYDGQDNNGPSRLVNIATRAVVGGQSDTLIAGFVVQGDRPRNVLVRAVGPALAAFGVSGALANPHLRLVRDGLTIAENDDWGRGGGATAEQILAAGARTGAFALTPGSRDAALVQELPAGAYSVQVSSVGGSSGVALVEVYEVP